MTNPKWTKLFSQKLNWTVTVQNLSFWTVTVWIVLWWTPGSSWRWTDVSSTVFTSLDWSELNCVGLNCHEQLAGQVEPVASLLWGWKSHRVTFWSKQRTAGPYAGFVNTEKAPWRLKSFLKDTTYCLFVSMFTNTLSKKYCLASLQKKVE